MKLKKKHYFIGIIVLVCLILAYHFYAAYQAEQQIDTAIQEQTSKMKNISVQYSSINIAPFVGKVSIDDLTFILGNNIERAQKLQFRASYIDFLNIYIGGIKYGLQNLDRAQITLTRPSYVNQSNLEEVKADTLHITYNGNALDGLQSAINGIPFNSPQEIDAHSSGLIFQFPNTTLYKLTAKNFSYSGMIKSGMQNFWTNGTHQFGMDSLTWTPSQSFQDSYSFFIKGFGYDTDAIPFKSAHLNYEPASQPRTIHVESTIKSDLALVSGSGAIQLKKPFGQSKLENMGISITEFSQKFSRVIKNMEKLLSVSLNSDNQGITLKLDGTVANPHIVK
ncbi:MAG TPA: hypothetical protein VJ964_13100 [Balneolaceae bacterium]|nr:hypothetical protein [Balneolaceae bacterium]